MNSEIVAVGTELLMGQIANTNAQYISQKLAEAGVNVYYHSVVGDNKQRIVNTIKLALERSDLIIVTGGLGPTQDDITKETIAEILGIPLIMDEKSKINMENYLNSIGRAIVESNYKQALIPEGAVVIPNDNGTAPGCIIKTDEKMIAIFPGPPREMKPMFDWFLKNALSQKEKVIESIFIRIFGIGESIVEEKIIELIEAQNNPTIATYIEDGTVIIRVTASSSSKTEAQKILKPVVEKIINTFHSNIFSLNGDSLVKTVVQLLKDKKLTLSCAESCTGGMISEKLVSISGASEVFDRSIVTYSNNAKIQMLGVKDETLKAFGAVSHETAKEMAEGARRISNTDIAVSVTGIAGPTGGTAQKPVGLVYIGISDKDGTDSWEFRFNGDRDRIRLLSTMTALDLLRRRILDI